MLEQKFSVSRVEVAQQLIFVSGRVALIQTKITNRTNKIRTPEVGFTGELLLELDFR